MRVATVFAVLGVFGCSGAIGSPEGRGPDGRSAPVQCDDGTAPSVAPLHRLATTEYVASLRALFGDAPVGALGSVLDALPPDTAADETFFARQDHRLSDRHVDGYFRVADALAAAALEDGALRARLGGACEAAIDLACLDRFVPTFLARALRRPPEADELADARALVEELGDPEAALHGVIFTTLMAPDFVYRFENRGSARGGVVTLTAHELASRLSYHFWGAPPDEALLDAAESGALDTPDGYARQVERLFADPRTEATLVRFFAEWMHLSRGDFEPSPRLEVLRDDLELSGLVQEMRAEVEALFVHALHDEDATWRDVLTSRESFARDPRLADIYGVAPWNGEGARPLLPEGERSGLLTRAAMLFSPDGSTNPFRRGVFVRRALLCDAVVPPPADLPADALTPPPVQPGASTRDAFEAKVADEPCASCHAQFSPLGYALEAFDGLGRFREEERLVTTEGDALGVASVDTVVFPRVEGHDATVVGTAVELNERIAESEKSSFCLSRQYFRFAYRHQEEGADHCTIRAWTRAIEGGQSLRDALRSIALDPHFRQRQLED